MNEKKTFVLDTSVLIHDPNAFFNFEEHDIIIPYIVIHEIDGLRKAPNGRGYAAREVIKQIDAFNKISSNLLDVQLGEGKGILSISFEGMPTNLDFTSDIQKSLRDDVIINCARKLQNNNNGVILVSKDIGQRIKASINGVFVQDYFNSKIKNWENRYTGLHSQIVKLPAPLNGDPYNTELKSPDYLLHNEFCYVKFEEYDNIPALLCRNKNNILVPVQNFKKGIQEIKPLDDYQRMALDVLTDKDVPLVALSGTAGSGKTLLSLATAMEQYDNEDIESIMYVKPIIPVGGRDIGYLPGDKEEKLNNWAKPIFDNLKVIEMKKNKKYGNEFFEEELNLELEAYTYMRGRTFHNSFILLDELQNTSPLEARTALSRIGENTKCVMLADLTQIDNQYTDAESCGFSTVTEALKDHPLFAAVPLINSQRSQVSQLVADRMNQNI